MIDFKTILISAAMDLQFCARSYQLSEVSRLRALLPETGSIAYLHAAFTCITLTIIILPPFAALYFSGLLKKTYASPQSSQNPGYFHEPYPRPVFYS
jgi:hypothetical protein